MTMGDRGHLPFLSFLIGFGYKFGLEVVGMKLTPSFYGQINCLLE
jgi:hypothetical protein